MVKSFSILIFTALMEVVCLSLPSNAAPKAIVSPAGFQITPAPGWHQYSGGQWKVSLVLYTQPAGGFAPNLTILKTKPSSGETLDVVRKEVQQTIPHMFPNARILAESIIKVDGVDALSFRAYYENGNPIKKMDLREVVIVDGERSYVVTLTTFAIDHAKYDQPFQQMVKSFHRLSPVTANTLPATAP